MNLSNNFACNHFRPNGISFFYREFRLLEMAMSLASDGEVYTVHSPRTHSHAQMVSCVWLKLFQAHIGVFFVCVVSKAFIVLHACHVSHVAWPATDFTFTEHSYLIFSVVPFTLACHFHSANWTLVWPICRTVSAHTRSALVTNRGFASVTDPIANCGSREDHRNPCCLARRADRSHARFPDQGHTARGRLRAHGWQIVVLPAPQIRAQIEEVVKIIPQEPVLSSTKSRSWTCSFPRPRTYRMRASQSALVTNRGFTRALIRAQVVELWKLRSSQHKSRP